MKVDVTVDDGDAMEQTRQWMRRRMAGTWVSETWWGVEVGTGPGRRQVPPAPHPEERAVERFHEVRQMPVVSVEALPSERDAYMRAVRSRLNRPLDWIDRSVVGVILAITIGAWAVIIKGITMAWGWIARWL